jgi:hypothetical protein
MNKTITCDFIQLLNENNKERISDVLLRCRQVDLVERQSDFLGRCYEENLPIFYSGKNRQCQEIVGNYKISAKHIEQIYEALYDRMTSPFTEFFQSLL